jgi:methenyltetrahydromethanopterin cyclohydrolase
MPSPYLLIIATSARMLAQIAYQAGIKAVVIDLFADTDTRRYATAWRQVASLSLNDLLPALEPLLAEYPLHDLIYGSGFESFPESLSYLNQRLHLIGNTSAVFVNTVNKQAFFAVLDSLQIPYPDSVFTPPAPDGGWLSKPLCGQGGLGIRHWQAEPLAENYWQKYQTGLPHSVLFLADGQHLQVLGFHRQWTTAAGSDGFLFAGLINCTALSARHKALITAWLSQLVPILGLKGLNSLDFIQDGTALWLLEINPRPSASMLLYGGDLLSLHRHACAGHLPVAPYEDSTGNDACAYQIIYAQETVYIPDTLAWPQNCADLPPAGTICHTGQPICSLLVRQKTAQMVYEQLQYQQRALLRQLPCL